MSFIITLYVREGIVLASDSRLTLNAERREKDKKIVQFSVGQSDTNYKTFLTSNYIGISTYGAAAVQNVPIGGYIESFINEHLAKSDYTVDRVPQEILSYFRNLAKPPDTGFIIAGYKTTKNVAEQHIWEVIVKKEKVTRLNKPDIQGASWRGETDILTRLIQPVGLQNKSGNFQQLPYHKIHWGFFSLQDAIDYAIYAVKVTIDTMRFHPRPKTVGGSIDVLVIKPGEAFWVQRKKLHV
jgi:hypothetical protein